MIKRILSIVLILAVLFAAMPSPSYAVGEVTKSNIVLGQYLVNLVADPLTAVPIGGAEGFGTASSDGRIWTDKNLQPQDDGSFDVTLSALAQEYITSVSGNPGLGGGVSDAPLADVTFVLDMSTSMNTQDVAYSGGNYYRVQAMAKAVNDAIAIVMDANPKNRVAVHWFGNLVTAEHVGTLMEMGSYTLASGTDYINYTNGGSHTLSTSVNLLKDGASCPAASNSLAGGTPTQDGILYGISKSIDQISKETKNASDPERIPYVFVLSDGAAIQAHKDWWTIPANPASPASYTRSGTNSNNLPNADPSQFANSATGSADIAASTILTGMYMKGLLEQAYHTYNGTTTNCKFYTVGLGADSAINGTSSLSVYAWAALDPANVYAHRSDPTFRRGTAEETHNKILEFTSGGHEAYQNLYTFSDYYKFADNFDLLYEAFSELSNDVAAMTAILPLTEITQSTTLSDGLVADLDGAIVLTDEIGPGFSVDPGTLKIGSTTAQVDADTTVSGGVVYKFSGYKSRVVVKTMNGVSVLLWYIDAEDMKTHIYRFSSRSNPQAGQYTQPTDGAFILGYTLRPIMAGTTTSYIAMSYYTNAYSVADGAKTIAHFTPPSDSLYYFAPNREVSKTSDAVGVSYVSKESVSASEVSMRLGNNGRIDLQLGIDKQGTKSVPINGTITYTVTVFNYTPADKTGLTVTSEGTTIPDVSIPAGSSTSLTFTATAPATMQTVTSGTAVLNGTGLPSGGIVSNTVKTDVYDNTPQTYNASVTVFKDGAQWSGLNVQLRQSGTQTSLSGNGVYSAAVLPGTYDAYVDGVDSGVDITVTDSASTANIYYVTAHFNTNGGSANPADQIVISGGTPQTPAQPTKAGNSFIGWSPSIGPITQTTTYTAQWVTITGVPTAPIEFHYNGATGSNTETLRIIPVSSLVGNLPVPTREGYVFTGWRDAQNNPITASSVMSSGGIQAFAAWQSVSTVKTVKPQDENVSGSKTIPKTADSVDSRFSIIMLAIALFAAAGILIKKRRE